MVQSRRCHRPHTCKYVTKFPNQGQSQSLHPQQNLKYPSGMAHAEATTSFIA